MEELENFFCKNYQSLRKYCSKFNDLSEDILNETFIIIKSRYKKVNFSLFTRIAKEAARNIGIHRYRYTDSFVIIEPPTEKARERLIKYIEKDFDEEKEVRKEETIKFIKHFKKIEEKTGQMNIFFNNSALQDLKKNKRRNK